MRGIKVSYPLLKFLVLLENELNLPSEPNGLSHPIEYHTKSVHIKYFNDDKEVFVSFIFPILFATIFSHFFPESFLYEHWQFNGSFDKDFFLVFIAFFFAESYPLNHST